MARRTFHPKEQLSFISTTRKIIIIIAIGFVLSVAITFSLYQIYTHILTQRAQSFALSLDSHEIEQLKNTSAPDSDVPYQKVKAKLLALKRVYSETRFVYVMDKVGDTLYFLADSESPTSPDYSPRNEAYPDATAADKALFTNKVAFLEGPVTDDYGTWYSALSPIVDENNTVVAVIGIDIPTSYYAGLILGIGLVPLLLAVALAVAVAFYDKSRRRQLEAFRLQIELSSIASHELDSPLKGIRSAEESLLKDTLTDTQRKLVALMYENTQHLQTSVSDILQLTSIDTANSASLSGPPVDLVPIIQEIINSQQFAAQDKAVQLVTAESAWPTAIPVQADTARLRRIFSSITSSGLLYARPNTHLTFSYEYDFKKRHHIIIFTSEITVASKDIRQIIRASNGHLIHTDDQTQAVSANLFLTQALVEQLKGKLWIERGDTTVATHVCFPFIDIQKQTPPPTEEKS